MIYHIRDFAQYIEKKGTEENATPAVLCALSTMNDGDTLSLDGKTLHLYPEGAYRAFYAISNNDAGEKPIAFPLIGRQGITIDGGITIEDGIAVEDGTTVENGTTIENGGDDGDSARARLIFHGRVLPFAIDRSEDITVRNITIDYASPYYAQPKIVEADETHTVLHFDSKECGCRVKDGKFCFYSRVDGWEHVCDNALSLEFSPVSSVSDILPHKTHAKAVPSAVKPPYFPYCGEKKDHGFLGGMFRDVTLIERAPDLIEMRGALEFVHTVGASLVMTHATREFPGVFITDAKNVKLKDVRLTYTSSMGVIAQTSENLYLEHVTAEVDEGSERVLSVNADAVHFVNCRGDIVMQHCKFTNMMDDACNIHGIYGILRGISGDGRELSVGFGHFQQEGILFVKPGDTIAVIDRTKTAVLCHVTAAQTALLSQTEMHVTLTEPLPEVVCGLDFASGDYLIENCSTAPNVTIRHCESGYNRPRGFLISTSGKTLIEDCTFYNMNTGVQIGGEMLDWYESGAVQDVTIRHCNFDDSAYAGGVCIDIQPRLVTLPKQPFHKKITVTENRFVQCHPRFLQAVSVETITFADNTFEKNEAYPAHPAHGDHGVSVSRCTNVAIKFT